MLCSSIVFAEKRKLDGKIMPYKIQVEEGRIDGAVYVGKYARNSDIDTGTVPESVGANPANNNQYTYAGFPSETETIQVLSDNAADAAAGTGARTIRVFYLDENKNCFDSNGEFLHEDFTLNGTTAVTGTNVASRVWRASILTSGSGLTNAGDITIRHSTTTANIFGYIMTGEGQTEISNFTICAGYTAYLERVTATLFDTSNNRGTIRIRQTLENGTQIIQRPFAVDTDQNFDREFVGVSFTEKTDIEFIVQTVLNTNADISISYRLRLVKN